MMQLTIWKIFGYLYDTMFRQYVKGAYDVIAFTMATVQLSEKSREDSDFANYLEN